MFLQIMLSAGAVVISLAALAVSSVMSWRQLKSMRSANHLPVAIELLTRDYGRPEFQRTERRILAELPAADPAGGVSGLPEPLHSSAIQVINFYDSMGILVSFGCVEEELVLASINHRIRRIWRTLEPFIRAERARRGGLYLDFLEDLAVRAHRRDPGDLHDQLGLREMPVGARAPARMRPPAPARVRPPVAAPASVRAGLPASGRARPGRQAPRRRRTMVRLGAGAGTPPP
ncbi:hypothetical protein [Actinoplanes sp. NPDC049599]|uniref:DUF4760 domain-containing protein n=1 Tax=Actinoplanes sp. NPDC049599 TaxID=3363903 RepID=UPI0037B1C168